MLAFPSGGRGTAFAVDEVSRRGLRRGNNRGYQGEACIFLRINLFDRFTTHLIRLLLRTAPQNPPSPAGEGYLYPTFANHLCEV